MWKKLTSAFVALMFSVAAHAQTREVADDGVYITDATGRYVRIEGIDGIVIDNLYDGPHATRSSGVAVHVREGRTLTVHFNKQGTVAVAGMPILTTLLDEQGRTAAVQADGKRVASLDYTDAGLLASVTVPGRMTWKLSPPDASDRIRQSVESSSGHEIAHSLPPADINPTDLERGAYYGAAANELDVALDSVTYQYSPASALITAHDAKGHVAFYVVHTDVCDVGFSPNGKALFYDLPISVDAGETADDGDIIISPAADTQRGLVPDHLLLTAAGTVGLYAEMYAPRSIATAWADRDGHVFTVLADPPPAPRSASPSPR